MALKGNELIEKALNLAKYTRIEINKTPGVYCFGKEILNNNGAYDLDPTKLPISCKKLGFTGYELYETLSNK